MRVGAEGKKKPKGKRLESGRRECWCCGRVSVGGAVAEMEKMEGLSLVAGLERKKKLERWG